MIECTGLRKTYGRTLAVDNLSFEVRPGVVTGFLGPNGAGKSTTMRLMLDLDRGAGATRFDGKAFREFRHPMREVGALLEAKAFHPTRTARNHLRMLAAANGIPDSRVDHVLELVGLGSVAAKKPKGYSLGMAQRLGLAAAMLGDPKVIILDEPANGLDPQGISWLREMLRAFAAQGRTVFVSSHLLNEVQVLADELVVIGRGRLIARGTIDDFVRASTHTAVIVRTPEAGRLAELLTGKGATVERADDGALLVTGFDQQDVGDLAFDSGVRLHELTTRIATLEQAFLEATAGDEEFETSIDAGTQEGLQ